MIRKLILSLLVVFFSLPCLAQTQGLAPPYSGGLSPNAPRGGGSQTPWTSDIDGAAFNLLDTTSIHTDNIYSGPAGFGIEFQSAFQVQNGLSMRFSGIEMNGTAMDMQGGTLEDSNLGYVQFGGGIATSGDVSLGYGNGLFLSSGGGGGVHMGGGTLDTAGGNIMDSNSGTNTFSGGANFNGGVSLGDNNLIGIVTLSGDTGLINGFAAIADSGGTTAIDINNHILYNIGSTQNLMDFSGGYDPFSAIWFDSGNNIGFGGVIRSSDGNTSINANARNLSSAGNNPIVDYSGTINNSTIISIDEAHNTFNVKNIPTSCSGLPSGDVCNVAGVLTIAP